MSLDRETTLAAAPPGGIRVPSSLWIDQPGSVREIEQRVASGALDRELGEGLAHFAEHGYVVLQLGLDEATCQEIEASIDRFWRQRPADLAYAYAGPARRMTFADEARDRRPGHRIHDPHSHCAAIRRLYLDRRIFDHVGHIFGETPVAIQSLFFGFGSQQQLHRDQVVVPIAEPGHMVGAWIALEDISPDSGPLIYVPGSHRLPYFETAPGEYQLDGARMGPEVIARGLAWEDEQRRRHGLERRAFTARRGEVLLWHASLSHGGAEVRDPERTRKSLVVHFSSRRTYRRRSISLAEPHAGGDRVQVMETEELLDEGGCLGFQNPILGHERR